MNRLSLLLQVLLLIFPLPQIIYTQEDNISNVHDLRPDDIKLILALGDSITTAFGAGAKCKNNGGDNNHLEELYEYRGVSYAMGGDDGTISLANFYKHYSPELRGASIGNHIIEFCYGILCPPKQYHPELDNLNAALSGAMVKNLDYEIDYLLSQYEKESEEFKRSNDICLICSHSIPWITEKKFERYLMNAIEKIRLNIPNVIINIMDEFNVSQIYDLTKGQTKYCTKLGPIGVHNRQEMDKLGRKYNEAIKRIVHYYSEQPSNTFAVINHHFEYNLTSFPIDSLSCVDCFHPSTKLHQFVAKTLWNSLPFSSSPDPKLVNWELDKKIRCWNEQDRIRTRFSRPWVVTDLDTSEDDTYIQDQKIINDPNKTKTQIGKAKAAFVVLIRNEHWSVPMDIDMNIVRKNMEKMREEQVLYGDSLPYRHMCRFESGFFYRHELLDKYDYYWRVEPGVQFYCDLDYDPFVYMKKYDIRYSFTISLYEYPKTIPTLWDSVREFGKLYPQYIEKDNLMDFISSDGGGFFYERWGDAPVHSIAASLFLKKHQIHFFNDIGYRHEPFSHCPADEKIQLKCHCNPHDSFDFHGYSCTGK
ncbi:1584_t:CDS:10 [Diversispora eburnea]|uniref:1584_t:CDS:1 n=1 Tax=Diversispora eburnea TaxID=1213867 RepID=A0A9N9BK22_9GLOM|nr:1584_t:CDS:10 [Diversispora eburnea]